MSDATLVRLVLASGDPIDLEKEEWDNIKAMLDDEDEPRVRCTDTYGREHRVRGRYVVDVIITSAEIEAEIRGAQMLDS